MSGGVTLDILQDKEMLVNFVEAKRGGICGIMCDRYINNSNNNKSVRYIDANNLYGYAMMQNFPCKDFEYITTISLDPRSEFLGTILKTPDDSDHGY